MSPSGNPKVDLTRDASRLPSTAALRAFVQLRIVKERCDALGSPLVAEAESLRTATVALWRSLKDRGL